MEYPVVCLDEQSKQLIAEVASPQPAQPGKPARVEDYEYRRNGTCKAFMVRHPLHGWRHVTLAERRPRKD